MLPDSRPLLPRAVFQPDRLQRLREQAYARLLDEEAALLPSPSVTRRWALGRIALAAGAMVAGIRPRAFASPGPRSTAPQYGVPGLAGNAPAIKPAKSYGREDLGSIASWNPAYTYVVTPGKGGKYGDIFGYSNKIRTIGYKPGMGELMALSVITDAQSGFSFVVPAEDAFYVVWGSELLGCRWGHAELILDKSFFRMKTPADGDAGVVERFALAMDDRALARADDPAREIHIALADGVPPGIWGAGDNLPNGRVYYPLITSAFIDKDVLTIRTYSGSFKIDLSVQKMIEYEGGR